MQWKELSGHCKRVTEEFSLRLPKLVSHIRSERFLSDVGEWEVCVGCRNMIHKRQSRLQAFSLEHPEINPSTLERPQGCGRNKQRTVCTIGFERTFTVLFEIAQ